MAQQIAEIRWLTVGLVVGILCYPASARVSTARCKRVPSSHKDREPILYVVSSRLIAMLDKWMRSIFCGPSVSLETAGKRGHPRQSVGYKGPSFVTVSTVTLPMLVLSKSRPFTPPGRPVCSCSDHRLVSRTARAVTGGRPGAPLSHYHTALLARRLPHTVRAATSATAHGYQPSVGAEYSRLQGVQVRST